VLTWLVLMFSFAAAVAPRLRNCPSAACWKAFALLLLALSRTLVLSERGSRPIHRFLTVCAAYARARRLLGAATRAPCRARQRSAQQRTRPVIAFCVPFALCRHGLLHLQQCCNRCPLRAKGRSQSATSFVPASGMDAGRSGFGCGVHQVHGLKKVAVVDFDVHHGNGTEKAFYDDDRCD
jgi:hypothetical protein